MTNTNIERDLAEVNADLVEALRERDAALAQWQRIAAEWTVRAKHAESERDALGSELCTQEDRGNTYRRRALILAQSADFWRSWARSYEKDKERAEADVARLTAERDDYRAKWKALSRQAGAGTAEWSNLLAERDALRAALKLLIDLSRGVAGDKLRQYTDADVEQLFAALLQADAALGAAQTETGAVSKP